MHERLDEPELLPVALRELPDRPVEDDAEPLAELLAEPGVEPAAKPGERLELLTAGQPVGEAQVAREVADPAARLDGSTPVSIAEDGRAAGGRADQPEQKPDRRALARPVRPEVPEDLAALDAQVEVGERLDRRAGSSSRDEQSRSASRRTWASIVCRWRPRPVRLAEPRTQRRRLLGRPRSSLREVGAISGRSWPPPS